MNLRCEQLFIKWSPSVQNGTFLLGSAAIFVPLLPPQFGGRFHKLRRRSGPGLHEHGGRASVRLKLRAELRCCHDNTTGKVGQQAPATPLLAWQQDRSIKPERQDDSNTHTHTFHAV
ncbi:hypothetical protein AMECASPLE_023176 [Ameca splendens]|uniref:Uncharacterized protein n=1 Tax=Ameca splendens TaxID=208324 RepID=A0ABV0YFN8_9TELE